MQRRRSRRRRASTARCLRRSTPCFERALAKDPAERYPILRRAGRESQGCVRRQRRHDGADGRSRRRRRRPPSVAPPRSRHTSRRSRRAIAHRCRARRAGASRASSSPRSSAEAATDPAADHGRPDGDRGRRAAGAHRDRRGAARDSSDRRQGRTSGHRAGVHRRADPPSTTRGSGCSRPGMRPPPCRFSSAPSPRSRAPAP